VLILAKHKYEQKLESRPEIVESEAIKEKAAKEIIENEIECPRCYSVMMLCSDFDSLYYICEDCDFSLYTVKKF
jgi:hypothetical protein